MKLPSRNISFSITAQKTNKKDLSRALDQTMHESARCSLLPADLLGKR